MPTKEIPSYGILITSWIPKGEEGSLRLGALGAASLSWSHMLDVDPDFVHLSLDSASRQKEAIEAIAPWFDSEIINVSVQERQGVGASLNAGISALLEQGCEYILYAVDDWQLINRLEISTWVKLLRDDESIGCVRFNPPHPDTEATFHPNFVGESQCWYGTLARHHYAFGFRPALYHRRFFDAYGRFREGVSSLDAETDYNARFCHYHWDNDKHGPAIVMAMPVWFDHIYTTELSAIVPPGKTE